MSDARFEVRPEIFYRDPQAALAWLDRVFGLATELLVTDAGGRFVFARVSGGVGIAAEAPDRRRSAMSLGGANSQIVTVTFGEGLDAHYAQARSAGAGIEQELREEFFGPFYTATDLEGHLWTFRQTAAGFRPPPEGWTVRFPNQETQPA